MTKKGILRTKKVRFFEQEFFTILDLQDGPMLQSNQESIERSNWKLIPSNDDESDSNSEYDDERINSTNEKCLDDPVKDVSHE